MQALTVRPGDRRSSTLKELAEPDLDEGSLLVQSLVVGLCGTDSEIINGEYGEAPPGEDFLVLGHENLGRVVESPPGSGLSVGDLVVGIVRRPDPEPCPACGAGEWDMCRNGRYTEHGIRGLHGFARERWRTEPDAVVRLSPSLGRLGVLLEPTTIVGALNREAVLGNEVIFGSVNANRRHYEQATRALAAVDRDWLSRLITRTVPLHRYPEAFTRQPDDVKVVIDLEATGQ